METTQRKLATLTILAATYFVTGKLGLTLAYLHPSATAVWAPAGIALAALLIFGYEVWPAILLGAFLVNITTDGSALVCVGIAVGNTLEALAGARLVNRYACGRNAIHSTPDIFKFAFLAGLVSPTIAATFGVSSLSLGGYGQWASYRAIWSTWWLGDAAGVILVTPLLLSWIERPRLRWRQKQFIEAAALFGSLVLVGLIVFDGLFDLAAKNYPLEYLCMPFLLWVAYRIGPREAATGTLILAGTAIWGTLHGYGPFGGQFGAHLGTQFGAKSSAALHNESLLLLQTFISVAGVTTMGLATAFAERRTAEEQSHFLAVSDPLTGLGNYRKLIDTLEMEIHRSGRTGRPFALLLLDMDDLKRINDTYGHLAGGHALCRLAKALRLSSRNIDTAARYGGDEFALVVPELGPDLGHELWDDAELEVGQKRRVKINPEPEPHSRCASDLAMSDPASTMPPGNERAGEPKWKRGHEILADFKTEATAIALQHIADRIANHLANDNEFPTLSVSIGTAQFPADGENIEQLLEAADQSLYRNKRARKNRAAPARRTRLPQRGTTTDAAPNAGSVQPPNAASSEAPPKPPASQSTSRDDQTAAPPPQKHALSARDR